MENCAGEDAIMTVGSDFSLRLNKKCELVPSGCISNKPFGTAVAKFKVQKDGIVMKEGKILPTSFAMRTPFTFRGTS